MTTKILFVTPSLGRGGTERHLISILPRLQSAGFDVSIFVFRAGGEWEKQLKNHGIKVITGINSKVGTVNYSMTCLLLIWTILKERPRIIHFFLAEAYILGGLISLLIPGLVRIMSRRSLNVYQQRYRVADKIESWLHKRMNAVLGNSQAICNELFQEGAPQDRVGLIYNGIDPVTNNNIEYRNLLKHQIGIDKDCLVIIIIANIIPYKGHEDLIRALAIVKDRLPSKWKLLIVGRDEGHGMKLKDIAQAEGIAGNIVFTGERDDTADLIGISDVGVLASHQEGFPNAVLEYMNNSLPIVVTDVGGCSEAIIDGETGIAVPAKDPFKLGDAIATIVCDSKLAIKYGNAARARVNAKFNIETTVSMYSDLYDNIINYKGLDNILYKANFKYKNTNKYNPDYLEHTYISRNNQVRVYSDHVEKEVPSDVANVAAKYSAIHDIAVSHEFIAPEVISCSKDTNLVTLSNIDNIVSVRELYWKYMIDCIDETDCLDFIKRVGQTLAVIHNDLDLSEYSKWSSGDDFEYYLKKYGYTHNNIEYSPQAILHGDYGFSNIFSVNHFNVDSPVVIIDPCADGYTSLSDIEYGPVYLDIGKFLMCLEGLISPQKHLFIKIDKINRAQISFINGYASKSRHAINYVSCFAFSYAIASMYLRQAYPHTHILALKLLYNGLWKRNYPLQDKLKQIEHCGMPLYE